MCEEIIYLFYFVCTFTIYTILHNITLIIYTHNNVRGSEFSITKPLVIYANTLLFDLVFSFVSIIRVLLFVRLFVYVYFVLYERIYLVRHCPRVMSENDIVNQCNHDNVST